MIEWLGSVIISYILGYGTHWWVTPVKECRGIQLDVPTKYYQDPLSIKPCPAGIDTEGRIHECYVDLKLKYVYTPEEQKKIEEFLMIPPMYLGSCLQQVNKYNNDKFYYK